MLREPGSNLKRSEAAFFLALGHHSEDRGEIDLIVMEDFLSQLDSSQSDPDRTAYSIFLQVAIDYVKRPSATKRGEAKLVDAFVALLEYFYSYIAKSRNKFRPGYRG